MRRKLLLPILLVLLLCGCSKQGDENTQLTIWHYYGGTAEETFSYLVQKFNHTIGMEQGITITARSYEGVSELAQAVNDSANRVEGAGDLPSIFAAYVDNVVPLDNKGLIADLGEYFTEEELDTYYKPFVDEGRLNGKLKILPIAKSTEVLHINKTLFDEFAAGHAYTYYDLNTWEGIVEIAAAYYDWTDQKTPLNINDGKAFFGTDGIANFMIMGTKQLGEDIFIEENGIIKHQFTEDVARKLWEVFYVPYIKGYFGKESSYCSDDIATGDLVAYIGSTASSYYFPNRYEDEAGQLVNVSCKTMLYPVFEGGEKIAVQQGAGMVVTKSTPEQEEAAATFLKWFTEEENNVGFAVSTGYMPVKNDALNIDVILEEIGRDGLVDESLPIINSTRSIYVQISNYDLYTSIPFEGSQDARTVLENSLPNKILSDEEYRVLRLRMGESYDSVTQELIGEDNFMAWYEDISGQLDEIINQ